MKVAEDTQDEPRRSGLQVAGRITIIPDLVRMQTVTSVQQRCSNPSKSPEMSGKELTQRISVFAGILQPPATSSKLLCRLCTAEGVGSNPLGSTPAATIDERFHHSTPNLIGGET